MMGIAFALSSANAIKTVCGGTSVFLVERSFHSATPSIAGAAFFLLLTAVMLQLFMPAKA